VRFWESARRTLLPDPAGAATRPPSLSDRLALWAFVALVVAAVPLVLFHYGDYHWFFRDDFFFLANRGDFPDLLEPHNQSHWSAVPKLIYFGLWQLFGLNTYLPYQASVLLLHLTAAVLIRLVMRRAGVDPWLSTAAAGIFVLFGPGAQNMLWGFQIGFTGSLVYGLVHLILADHDGRFGRRDVVGLGFGSLALMSSGVGVTMAVIVGIATLVRRGWRSAFLHTAPLAALFGIWALIEDPSTDSTFGRPAVDVLASWVRSSVVGTFLAIGGDLDVLAAVFAATIVAALVLALGPWRTTDLRTTRRRLAAPAALFIGGAVFAASTGLGRWWQGDEAARASRYVHLGAALSLPLLAWAIQELARRWRVALPVALALLLAPIPLNLGEFAPDQFTFGEHYMAKREYILTTAVRMPFADDVPRDVQPVPDPFASDAVTIGFLLTAERNGDLTPSSHPLGPDDVNEFKVRLGVAATDTPTLGGDLTGDCRPVRRPVALSPSVGDVFVARGPVQISTREGERASGPPVFFEAGSRLEVVLDDLRLLVGPAPRQPEVTVCSDSGWGE
jgi:hypothetical protein